MKGLRLNIFKSALGDCTNGGMSSSVSQVTLVGEGVAEIFDANENAPAVKIVTRNIYGRDYSHLEPIEGPEHIGWMAGGNFAYTSDSRFPSQYPLSIHDRQETPKQYEMLSR